MALPATGVATDLMIGRAYINFRNTGWSERFILGKAGALTTAPPTYTEAAALMKDYCMYRSATLGNGCVITWAMVSKASIRGDSVRAIGGPVQPVDLYGEGGTVSPINDVEVGPWFRFENGAGAHNQRIFRGMRDDFITDMKLDSSLFATMPVNTDAYTAVVAGTITSIQAVKNLLLWVINNTVQAKKIPGTPVTWTLTTNANVSFRYVGDRDVGRPFELFRGKAPTRV